MLVCRDVTKISNCRVNTTNGRGIKQLRISFGSIFLLFYMKVAGSHVHGSWVKTPAPPLNDSLGFIIIIIIFYLLQVDMRNRYDFQLRQQLHFPAALISLSLHGEIEHQPAEKNPQKCWSC